MSNLLPFIPPNMPEYHWLGKCPIDGLSKKFDRESKMEQLMKKEKGQSIISRFGFGLHSFFKLQETLIWISGLASVLAIGMMVINHQAGNNTLFKHFAGKTSLGALG